MKYRAFVEYEGYTKEMVYDSKFRALNTVLVALAIASVYNVPVLNSGVEEVEDE